MSRDVVPSSHFKGLYSCKQGSGEEFAVGRAEWSCRDTRNWKRRFESLSWVWNESVLKGRREHDEQLWRQKIGLLQVCEIMGRSSPKLVTCAMSIVWALPKTVCEAAYDVVHLNRYNDREGGIWCEEWRILIYLRRGLLRFFFQQSWKHQAEESITCSHSECKLMNC